jgi:hypothetical protein
LLPSKLLSFREDLLSPGRTPEGGAASGLAADLARLAAAGAASFRELYF